MPGLAPRRMLSVSTVEVLRRLSALESGTAPGCSGAQHLTRHNDAMIGLVRTGGGANATARSIHLTLINRLTRLDDHNGTPPDFWDGCDPLCGVKWRR
ncbi:MAG: hypothetical protein M3N46_09950 [Actinomycetota bacterium]|nr:hypothetical protein [Actinomycetota bacterium]